VVTNNRADPMEQRERDHSPQRVLMVGSAGGHLAQLLRLEPWLQLHDVSWVTFDLPDARSSLDGQSVVWAHHPTTRNIPNLIRNTVQAVATIRRHQPELIISSGAAVAVPYFWIGKLFRCRTVYIEVVDRVDTRTLTARLVSPVTDVFMAQVPEQIDLFPGSILIGRLL